MAKISTDAEINSVRLKEQASAPATPASGYFQFYCKADGKFYTKNDTGTEVCITDLASGGGLDPSGWESADAMTYASADDPTFTVTITGDQSAKYSVGMRVKLTQSTGGTKYFIITKIAVSTDTTLTLYGGTDYNLENEAISNPYYSVVKVPQGFPLDLTKWTVEVTDSTQRTQASPTQNTWYNLGSISISIPIGFWKVEYKVLARSYRGDISGDNSGEVTLSTANNSESNTDFTTQFSGFSIDYKRSTLSASSLLNLASKTVYYLNIRTIDTGHDGLDYLNDEFPCIIRATCAYL